MTSPARRHFEKTIAAQQTSEGSNEERAPLNANQYELMLVKLATDNRRLKTVQSLEARAEIKRELLPEYAAWVEGVIQGDQGLQDDVLMSVMVWHIDAGNLQEAINIAAYAIKHKLKMPDRYQRQTAVVIAEEVADYYLKAHNTKEPLDISIIRQTIDITLDQDMPDEVKAKLYKVLGYALLANEALVPVELPDDKTRYNAALSSFNRALALHEKSGVKKDIEYVERQLKNLAASAA